MQSIPEPDDLRADLRSHVFLMAVLSTGKNSCPVRVRNLSVHGALLEGSSLPVDQRPVFLKRGSLAVTGQIAWASGRNCGIRFVEPINVNEWVDRIGPVGQQRIDAVIAEHRNVADPKRKPNPASSSLARQPNELLMISARLLQISERISELPGMSIELAEEVLKIEATASDLRNLGRTA
jgi:hypothetical protein